ncbi:MAG TPA: PilT/PilU family type 4a pilus ATPase [Candidatus Omnitrophota bacterium]|nr:PilT/PilU family type 4a pilus ATPase [Candidatus Omnitrophota bacterium]
MSQLTFRALLEKASQKKASDLHLVTNKHPLYRVHGELNPDQDIPPLSGSALKQIIFEILIEKQKDTFLKTHELDFSYKALSDFQFRVNVHMEKGEIAATVRITPSHIPTLEELGLPPVIDTLIQKRKGMVLLAGTAGSGKSTTLTYLIDRINRDRKCKIITIEDPIEYVHDSKQSLVIQREVGSDTDSFASALKYALRQDPDVVVVGEMRDKESISMALTTAETGHLVFATIHSSDAVETLNRIIDAYGPSDREQICAQLSGNLLAIIYQILIPRKDVEGRVLATETMLGTMAVRNLIRRKDFIEIRGQMEEKEKEGMHTLEMCLSELIRKDLISEETARLYAKYPNLLKMPQKKSFGEMADRNILKSRPAAQAMTNEETPPEKEDNKNIKLLLIDSKLKENQGMAEALRKSGYQHIFSAEKGREGLEKAKALQADIVILDTFLPDMDSFELCKMLKQQMPNIKTIIATSKLEPTDPANAERAKADDFVIKTSTFDLICRSVKKANLKFNSTPS